MQYNIIRLGSVLFAKRVMDITFAPMHGVGTTVKIYVSHHVEVCPVFL